MLNTAVSLTAILVLAWAFERKYKAGTPAMPLAEAAGT
jgi:hypothetical protein